MTGSSAAKQALFCRGPSILKASIEFVVFIRLSNSFRLSSSKALWSQRLPQSFAAGSKSPMAARNFYEWQS
jgi:hypothetical protein